MFTSLYALLQTLRAHHGGVASLEYGVLAAVVIAAVAAVGTGFSTTVTAAFTSIGDALTAAN